MGRTDVFTYVAALSGVAVIGLGLLFVSKSSLVSHHERASVYSRAGEIPLTDANSFQKYRTGTNNPAVKMFNLNMLEQVLMMPAGK